MALVLDIENEANSTLSLQKQANQGFALVLYSLITQIQNSKLVYGENLAFHSGCKRESALEKKRATDKKKKERDNVTS